MLRIDHVIYGVQDLDKAADRFLDEFGLGSIPGGHHPHFGTANRIVPLGEAYIELMAITDPTVAEQNLLGRTLAAHVAGGDRLFGWCVSADDIAGVASRLKLTPVPGVRHRIDGTELSWRLVGLENALVEPWLPFFIHWNDPDRHPGRERVKHRVKAAGITWVEVGGDPRRLRDWLLAPDLPVRPTGPQPTVCAVGIATPDGEILVR